MKPLTGAERAKRFREKLKEDPEKYEKYKQKQKELVAKRRKKIGDLDENEKEKQREQWRKQKRSQKERKKETINKETIPIDNINKQSKKTRNGNKKLQRIYTNYYRAQQKQQKLNAVISRLRKQLFRTNQKLKCLEISKNITEKELGNLKDALKETYTDCKTLAEKRILKKVSIKFSQKSGKNVKMLGLKTRIRFFYRSKKKYMTLKVFLLFLIECT